VHCRNCAVMRRLPFLVCALTLLVAAAPARAAGPQTGGSSVPTGGGVTYNEPLRKVRAWNPASFRPVAREFSVAPNPLVLGSTATFTYRIDSREDKRVQARIVLRRAGKAVVELRLGAVTTGERHVYKWTPSADDVAAGRYAVRLRAVDPHERVLRRTAQVSGRGRLAIKPAPPPPPVAPIPAPSVSGSGTFPILGDFSFGGEDARFGAGREGHIHQGQDVMAAEGTPLVAPLPGTVYWVDYQAGGAGHYVVERADDGRDYVFMHLEDGSIMVAKGDRLAQGQQFGRVGSTGSSSGPHLHFEIWPDGWYASKTSAPIDPLPQLQAWAAAR
jgi:murein DD-endopeptidase MepM/ murein hydrolase activator NlpD